MFYIDTFSRLEPTSYAVQRWQRANEDDATSDVHGLAWPESRGLGSAQGGSGLGEIQARPWALALAGSKPGPAQARACSDICKCA